MNEAVAIIESFIVPGALVLIVAIIRGYRVKVTFTRENGNHKEGGDTE